MSIYLTLMSDEPLPISLLRATKMMFSTNKLSPPQRLLMVAISEALDDYDSKSARLATSPTPAPKLAS